MTASPSDPAAGAPLVVAVTGGIASGKSALTARLQALGAPVADADVIAHAVVEPGSDGLAEVVARFGAGVLDAGGRLDRAAMRRRVFADPGARRQLEAIIHPRVRRALAAAVAAWSAPYGVLAIPLLAENAHAYAWVDRVLVVDVPEPVQVERLVARDGIDPALARQILAAQATRDQRLAIADDVHDATGPLAALDDRAAGLHRHYLGLARAKAAGTLSTPRIRAAADGAGSTPTA